MYFLALTLLIIAIISVVSGTLNITAVSLLVIGIAALRTLWLVWRNPSTIARTAGEIAAKGANHVDTFKEAFKDGRNK